ncbi:MAG TPA: hypothetical protein VF388_11100 [Lacunisphaera sp.]
MKWILLVALAGLCAAAPFLTSRALGTSEAYNYSLAVADAVTQERAGTWPALAGQSEFAFNSRIHPVRTAPYMTAFAGALDFVTFRSLSFWTLQNLTIALSLIAGALTGYWALRRTTPVEPDTAAFLAAAYVLSPGVLAPAYTMDLYMTVMLVPYLPLVMAGNLLQFERRSFTGQAWLAAVLAVCWLAHSPVAVWAGTATVIIQVAAFFVQRPKWRDLPAIAGAAVVFLALAAFGLAAALTISGYSDITHVRDTTMMLSEINRAAPGAVSPVSDQAGQLGDFQLGYGYSALGLIALGLGLWRRSFRCVLLVAIAAFYLALTLPVPGLTPWLWAHLPTLFINLTNQWPMQRLYLPATALIIFAFALVWRAPTFTHPLFRDIRRVVLAVFMGWTGWQSWHYLHRGLASHKSETETVQSHLNSNVELTLISYAIILTPGDFSNGVMDPAFGFRLLAPDDFHELAANWRATFPASAENQHGTLFATASDSPDVLDLPHPFVLQPGARYRLTLKFLVPPGEALLQFRGPSLFRKYILPTSGGVRAFGMLPGHNPSLSLWTSQSTPETMELRLVGGGLGNSSWRGRAFAEFTFERVDPAALPVELKSLLPLRAQVRAPAASWLETPRMFLDGYEATVNGQPAKVQRAADGLLLVAVPAGASEVEVRYVGPLLVRRALAVSRVAWLAMGAWAFLLWGPARPRNAAKKFLATLVRRGQPAAG